MAILLYHSINGGSISVFTSSNSNNKKGVLARMAMDAANRLSAIAAEMGQLLNAIQEHRRGLNILLRSVRTMDPARKEARIRATRERIEGLENRLQALRAEQEDLIVRAVTHGYRGDSNRRVRRLFLVWEGLNSISVWRHWFSCLVFFF